MYFVRERYVVVSLHIESTVLVASPLIKFFSVNGSNWANKTILFTCRTVVSAFAGSAKVGRQKTTSKMLVKNAVIRLRETRSFMLCHTPTFYFL